jgi:hypothetical protein
VRDYPLSDRADAAKEQLTAMNRPVPQPDPVAYARMKYELENQDNPGMMHHVWGIFKKGPDTTMAAKSGNPAMTGLRPSIPASVPVPAGAAGTGVNADVSVSTVADSTALDNNPDARQNPPAPPQPAPAGATPGTPATTPAPASSTPEAQSTASANQPLPSNHQMPVKAKKAKKEKKKKTTK